MLILSPIWYFFASLNRSVQIIDEDAKYTDQESLIFRRDVIVEGCTLNVNNIGAFTAHKSFEVMPSGKLHISECSALRFSRGFVNRGLTVICLNSISNFDFIRTISNYGELILVYEGSAEYSLPLINNYGKLYLSSSGMGSARRITTGKLPSPGEIHLKGVYFDLSKELS